MKRLVVSALAVGLAAAGSIVAIAPAAHAASSISVDAEYLLHHNQGYEYHPLDPGAETDVRSGDSLVRLTITNNDTETYTLDSVAPTRPNIPCAGSIAPGASLTCEVGVDFAVGSGVLDLTLAGSFPTAGADTTVVSYPYFGVDYRPTITDFAIQAPPPATGWLDTIPDPQLLNYPGLFRPEVRWAARWDGNTPVTITRATAALAAYSDECFGTLPKVVNPGDEILSCIFTISASQNNFGFQYTGVMGEQQALADSVSSTGGGGVCKSSQDRYAGGETVVVNCINLAPGVSAQMRVWNVGVSQPVTVAADGTAQFTFPLPTITTGFPSAALIFRTGEDPQSSGGGSVAFTIDPGEAAQPAPGAPGGSGTTTALLADTGSDVSGPVAAALLAVLTGLALIAIRRRTTATR